MLGVRRTSPSRAGLEAHAGVLDASIVLPRVAVAAGGHEVRLVVSTAARECLDVIYDRAKMIEERRAVTSPPNIVVSERPIVSAFPTETSP